MPSAPGARGSSAVSHSGDVHHAHLRRGRRGLGRLLSRRPVQRPWKSRRPMVGNCRQQAGCRKTKRDLQLTCWPWHAGNESSRCFRCSRHHNKSWLRRCRHHMPWLSFWTLLYPCSLIVFLSSMLQVQPSSGSTWWFQIFFYFHPYLGKISNLTSIFQRGFWNHQLGLFFHFQGACILRFQSLILMVFKDRGLPHWLRQLRRCFGELGLVFWNFGWVLGVMKITIFFWEIKECFGNFEGLPLPFNSALFELMI